MMKVSKWIYIGLAALLFLASVPLFAVFADHGGKDHERWKRGSKADGQTLTLSFSEGVRVHAVIRLKDGQLFVPVQPIFDAFQIPYILYPKGSILEGFANGKHFIFHADKRVMYLDGQKKSMTIAAFTTSDEFYVPLNAMAEVLGYTVITKQENNTILFLR